VILYLSKKKKHHKWHLTFVLNVLYLYSSSEVKEKGDLSLMDAKLSFLCSTHLSVVYNWNLILQMFYSPFNIDKLLWVNFVLFLLLCKCTKLLNWRGLTKSSSGEFYGLKQDESHEFATGVLQQWIEVLFTFYYG